MPIIVADRAIDAAAGSGMPMRPAAPGFQAPFRLGV
jgi:hypothetical protein